MRCVYPIKLSICAPLETERDIKTYLFSIRFESAIKNVIRRAIFNFIISVIISVITNNSDISDY